MNQKVNENLEQLRQAVRRGNLITTALLAVLVLEVAAIGYYAYTVYRKYTDPEFLVALAEKKVEKNYPQLKKKLVQELMDAAPELAEKASKRAVASAPQAREEVEDFLKRQFDLALKEVTEFGTEKFRQFVQDHEDTVREVYHEIKEIPGEATQSVVKLEKSLEEALGADYQTQAGQLLAFLESVNRKLEYLQTEPKLDTAEFLELRMLRIVRTLQLKQVGPIKPTPGP